MKKKLAILFVSCLMLALAMTYTTVEAEDGLAGWYKQTILNIKENISDLTFVNTELENKRKSKITIAIKESHEELNTTIEQAKISNLRNIEIYQQAYLDQLTGVMNELKANDLTAYTEGRKSKINVEVSQEINQYLIEILGE